MSIIREIIRQLDAKQGGYCQITNKCAWLNYLADGALAFHPADLRDKIETVVNYDKPRGQKLFCPEQHFKFTMNADKKPCRPEEALERFIVNTNRDHFCNQISIGGRKESIDIGIKEGNDKYTFVELKPWRSTNSPMYAIVECLKSLTQYRAILNDKNRNIKRFNKVDLIVLAPLSYYRQYELIDDEDNCRQSIAGPLSRLLGELSGAFGTTLTLMALNIDRHDFGDKCARIYEARNVTDQSIIELNESDTIPSLKRDQWCLVATSGNR